MTHTTASTMPADTIHSVVDSKSVYEDEDDVPFKASLSVKVLATPVECCEDSRVVGLVVGSAPGAGLGLPVGICVDFSVGFIVLGCICVGGAVVGDGVVGDGVNDAVMDI